MQLAVETYIAARDLREAKRHSRTIRSDASQRLGRYVLSPDVRVSRVTLQNLEAKDLQMWRRELPQTLKATTGQRLVNDFKAALNAAYNANMSRLGPDLPAIIKQGLRSEAIEPASDSLLGKT